MKNIFNKQIFNLVLVALIGCVVPLQAQVFKDQKNNIALTVVDYADNPDVLLYYKQNKPIRANTLMVQGAHPLRIVVENKTNQPIEINPKSIFLTQYILPLSQEDKKIDYTATKAMFGIVGSMAAAVTAIVFSRDYNSYYNNYSDTILTAAIGSVTTLYMMSMGFVIDTTPDINMQLYFELPVILHESIIIEPGKKVEQLILLTPQGYKRLFNFRVFTKDAQDIAAVFDVDLRTE
jgi:hypothetical protein